MSLPYQDATAGNRALDEISRVLGDFGCTRFGVMQDAGQQLTIVQFTYQGRDVQMQASWGGYASLWLKENPWSSRRKGTEAQWKLKAMTQAQVSVCSLLRDWIKGQVLAVECSLMTFQEAFMPHMLLPDGRRFAEAAVPMLEQKP